MPCIHLLILLANDAYSDRRRDIMSGIREYAKLQVEVVRIITLIEFRRLDEGCELETHDQTLLAHRINELLLANLLAVDGRLCGSERKPEKYSRLTENNVHVLWGRTLNVVVEGLLAGGKVVNDEIVIHILDNREAEAKMDGDDSA
jgi:hypothetical protein